MSVFRVKNSPYYQFDFQIKGHRFYGTTEETDERAAKAAEKLKRREAEQIVKAHTIAGRQPLNVEEAFDKWWDQVGRHGSDPDLKRALEWLKEQIGPKVHLHAITDTLVSDLVEARRKHVKLAGKDANGVQLYRPLSNRTVNKTVTSLLSRVFTRSKQNWNATILVEPNWSKHWLPETKRPVREITPDEESAIDQEEGRDYALLREFFIIMGLRRREVLLTWPQVDFDLAVIRIIGKGGIPAVLPLSKRAYEILWSLRGHNAVYAFTFIAQRTRQCPKTGTKFVRGERYPITYHGLSTNKRRKWAKAGVQARIHDLRHTTGMRTLRATGNLKAVQKLLRHADIATTAKFYTDANVEDLRTAMETTANRIESQNKSQTENSGEAKPITNKGN